MDAKNTAYHNKVRIEKLERALLATERAYRDQKTRADYWEEMAKKRGVS